MAFLQAGFSQSEISSKLEITLGTLYLHLSTLMKIYNTKNRINLIYKTFQDNTINYSKLNFTSRDIQIINHLLDGETSKNIANKIGISFYCVRRHKENMLTRNNCRTIIELISKLYSKNE